jgi:ketosteroid isomerase-like protein
MTTMTKTTLNLAEAYYQAIGNKDTASVAELLHPDVHLIGPLSEVSGKEAVLGAITNYVAQIKGLSVQAGFGSEEQAMVKYDVDFGQPLGICRTAALLTFKDNLIARLELFFDARPFEKMAGRN